MTVVNNSTPWSLRAYCAQRGPRRYLSKGGGLILVWWSLLPGVAGNSIHPSVDPFVHLFIHSSIYPVTPSTHIYCCLLCARPEGFGG